MADVLDVQQLLRVQHVPVVQAVDLLGLEGLLKQLLQGQKASEDQLQKQQAAIDALKAAQADQLQRNDAGQEEGPSSEASGLNQLQVMLLRAETPTRRLTDVMATCRLELLCCSHRSMWQHWTRGLLSWRLGAPSLLLLHQTLHQSHLQLLLGTAVPVARTSPRLKAVQQQAKRQPQLHQHHMEALKQTCRGCEASSSSWKSSWQTWLQPAKA